MHQHRTKIVATLGPATDDPSVLRECLAAGLDIARLNAAHGSDEDKHRRVRALRRTAEDCGLPVGLLVDLPGPKFRLGNLPDGQRELRRGRTVILGDPSGREKDSLPIRDARILSAVAPGHFLHLADGTVTLRILRKARGLAEARVIVGGVVRSGTGISMPDTDIRITIPTPADLKGIALAAAHKAEWVGVSFVRTARDLVRVRRAFARLGHSPRIIAKIEKPQALSNLDSLLKEADGLMVARGDLGVETPLAQVPLAQKRIIARANEAGKPVITATQMLESMVTHRWPTRAEVTDVANAVLDGTDAVMLSAETAVGKYPAEAVRMLGSVLKATEEAYPYQTVLDTRRQRAGATAEDAVSRAACRLAWDAGARAIVVSSGSAALPYSISRFRPPMPVIVFAPDQLITRQLSLSWGIQPVQAGRGMADSPESVRSWLLTNRMARRGQCAVWIHSGKDTGGKAHSIQLIPL